MAEVERGQKTGPENERTRFSEMSQTFRPKMKRSESEVLNNRRSLVTSEQHSAAFKAISEALSNSTK